MSLMSNSDGFSTIYLPELEDGPLNIKLKAKADGFKDSEFSDNDFDVKPETRSKAKKAKK